ncbi:MalY/PatB family protein [Mangrovicoccus algicola]|uniref:cysteine-S-conjugate beta-lyase n=1 Tax=Mangrovicoccus algicola TaxID=2771008 RepID=A0A8J6YW62_9RHOB|nr:MalY/PatB family protein [Mangrovicoccus algicola]MBE3638737.1 pyridoxal phosphate-dependent aminotransferase [Mangrovicoccus algicola]
MGYDFDRVIERRGSNSAKWDAMETLYGVDPQDGLAMWVADADFATAPVVTAAMRAMADHGVYGYTASDAAYREAVCWWMRTRHGWEVAPEAVFTTNGLCNAVALVLDAMTAPGDEIILMAPVYHAFAKTIRNAGRVVAERPLVQDEAGLYRMDLPAWEAAMTGRERAVILCSPHNPGGRVWTAEEQRALAEFAARHDLLVISDEIHQDLTFPGATHVPFLLAAPDAAPRTAVLNAPSKTFNTAGMHCGQVILPDPALRGRFAARMQALAMAPSSVGQEATRAAYSPEGAAWVDALRDYLDGNRRLFDAGVNAIPGLRSMPLEATYLAWVDFSGTGMETAEILDRVQGRARIAGNLGASFGTGGESFLRFNLATQRARIEEAVARLQAAFADLQ